MSDFNISNQGSVVGFTPLTEAAQDFLDTQVQAEPWQFMGTTLWVDHRMADNLIDGIQNEGLEVS